VKRGKRGETNHFAEREGGGKVKGGPACRCKGKEKRRGVSLKRGGKDKIKEKREPLEEGRGVAGRGRGGKWGTRGLSCPKRGRGKGQGDGRGKKKGGKKQPWGKKKGEGLSYFFEKKKRRKKKGFETVREGGGGKKKRRTKKDELLYIIPME